MRKTKIGEEPKIQKRDRLCDSVDVTLRDIIVKDLLTKSDKNLYYSDKKSEQLELFNIYIDNEENNPDVRFNFSINGEPASKECSSFEMFTLSGNDNESGNDPYKIVGTMVSSEPDTIVSFDMPIDPSLNTFPQHRDGYSYANYVVYGVKKNKSKIMLGKGKIYMTNILFDLTESILNGQ